MVTVGIHCRTVGVLSETVGVLSKYCRKLLSDCRTRAQVRGPVKPPFSPLATA